MKRVTVAVGVALVCLTGCRVGQSIAPVVTKVHTVSIHVKDHAVHEGVYRFLKETLGLPEVYAPMTYGQRRYAGLWAGNLVIEPCGPYSNMTYATPDFTAMFYGITFEAYESSTQSAAELDRRGIEHEPPYAFVVISDPNLCGEDLIVSIMDNPDRDQERAKHDLLTAQLGANHGGPLGIQYVQEIQVGFTDERNVEKWEALLTPLRRLGGRGWRLGDGPAIRLVKTDLKEIKAVVFKVASLDSAIRYLEAEKMLGDRYQDGVKVRTPGPWEFTIVLHE